MEVNWGSLPISNGIGPINWFWERAIYSSWVRLVSEIGNLPSKLLLERNNDSSCVRFPSDDGISPWKRLSERYRLMRFARFPNVDEVDRGNCCLWEREQKAKSDSRSNGELPLTSYIQWGPKFSTTWGCLLHLEFPRKTLYEKDPIQSRPQGSRLNWAISQKNLWRKDAISPRSCQNEIPVESQWEGR